MSPMSTDGINLYIDKSIDIDIIYICVVFNS